MNSRSVTSRVRFAIDGDHRWTITECHHDLAAFLRAGLQAEPRLTRNLHGFAQQRRNTNKSWQEIIEAFCEIEDFGDGIWVNTYDHANLLRPGARYFQIDSLVILQPHSDGTDARIGYGEPRCFHDLNDWLYRHGEAVLAPEGDRSVYWVTTDAGESWRAGGAYADLYELPGTSDPADRGEGKLFVSKGLGFCPFTGAQLELRLPSSLDQISWSSPN